MSNYGTVERRVALLLMLSTVLLFGARDPVRKVAVVVAVAIALHPRTCEYRLFMALLTVSFNAIARFSPGQSNFAQYCNGK